MLEKTVVFVVVEVTEVMRRGVATFEDEKEAQAYIDRKQASPGRRYEIEEIEQQTFRDETSDGEGSLET